MSATVSSLVDKKAFKPKVLVVDDEVENLELMGRVLRKEYEVFLAESGEQALGLMNDHDFFLIITDQRMPKMTGTQFLEESLKRTPGAIRILITGFSDIESVIEAINKGAVHRYVKKPWKQQELRREIEMSIQIQMLQTENQQLVRTLTETNKRLEEQDKLLQKSLDERSRQLLDANRELEDANKALHGLTLKDGLTGLYNHRGFQERVREEFYRSKRTKKDLSLIFFDIDHFKVYNDTNGHPLGDELLKEVAKLLRETAADQNAMLSQVRVSDIVARYGGEEFVVLLPETPLEGAQIKAERIRKAIEGHQFTKMESQPLGKITVSVGVANFPADCQEVQELTDRADQAMYVAKRSGRNRVVLYKDIKE